MDAPPPHHSTLDHIRALKLLGKGAMGTVFLAHDPTSSSPFALKVVDKSTFPTKFQAHKRALTELHVLSLTTLHPHPFLPLLLSCFDTPQFLAWSLPYCSGHDLNSLRHSQPDRVFSPSVSRFYLSEIISALEHLHGLGIAYRDLKPENVLIQSSGHVTLTDFDLSRSLSRPPLTPLPKRKRLKKAKSARVSPLGRRARRLDDGGEKSYSFVGTEEYIAPEVVSGEGHEFAVDWWALGVLAYEMTYGTTPFKGRNRNETFFNVLNKKPVFFGKRSELTDLIEKLLAKDPTKRLGHLRGASQVKEHVFFKGVKWDLLEEVLRPPFIPPSDDELTAYGDGYGIEEYFDKLRAPPTVSFSPSPSPSPSFECRKEVSFAEF